MYACGGAHFRGLQSVTYLKFFLQTQPSKQGVNLNHFLIGFYGDTLET